MGSLRLAMRYRFLTLLLCIATALANIPLYKMVKQDYIPTNVDESEFEVGINAKEGASLFSMDETMSVVEEKLQEVDGVEFILTTVGSRGFGGLNSGSVYVRIKEASERTFSLERLWHSLLEEIRWLPGKGIFSQQEKMTEIRKLLSSIPDVRPSVRNLSSLRQGPNVDIDFFRHGIGHSKAG